MTRADTGSRAELRRPGRESACVVDRVRVLAKLDELVFETVRGRLGDFDAFKGEVLAFLKR